MNFKNQVIRFKKSPWDESYAEPGMKARVISQEGPDCEGLIKVVVDYIEFEAFNEAFEAHDWYLNLVDKSLMGTAKEAGRYHRQEAFYFNSNEEMEQCLELAPVAQGSLREQLVALKDYASREGYFEAVGFLAAELDKIPRA